MYSLVMYCGIRDIKRSRMCGYGKIISFGEVRVTPLHHTTLMVFISYTWSRCSENVSMSGNLIIFMSLQIQVQNIFVHNILTT